MSRSFFDYDDGDFLFDVTDSMAMDSDGDLMMRMSDNTVLDLNSGELHFISLWEDGED